MPRALKLLLLLVSALVAPPCALAAPHPVPQQPSANGEESNLRKADLAAARCIGGDLLELYVRETARAEEQYPMPPNANEETRKPVFEKREAALALLKERMRATADRLETLAEAKPDGASRREAQELAETLRVYGSGPGDPSAKVFRQAEVTTKPLITYRPEPGFTAQARRSNVSGVVRLRAVLASDGRVRHILVIRGLPDGLTEKAVEAARVIRFTPATVGGRPVSQFVLLEYNFNL